MDRNSVMLRELCVLFGSVEVNVGGGVSDYDGEVREGGKGQMMGNMVGMEVLNKCVLVNEQ